MFVIILLVLVLVVLEPWFVSLLWNWLMPYLFKLPTIDYWQALGLVVLSWMIFPRSIGGSKRNS